MLTQAIKRDTEFLTSQSVMDYSLLVGLDQSRNELVVGIIGKYLKLSCMCLLALSHSNLFDLFKT